MYPEWKKSGTFKTGKPRGKRTLGMPKGTWKGNFRMNLK